MSGNHHAAPADFSVAFLAAACLSMAAAPVALLMPRDAGDDLTGRRAAAGDD
jgi:hypothetical protein